MKRLLATAALALSLFTTTAHADEIEAAMRVRTYSAECKGYLPLSPELDKLALAMLWANVSQTNKDRMVSAFMKIADERDRIGKDTWCAITSGTMLQIERQITEGK